jgi:hypothetical protein
MSGLLTTGAKIPLWIGVGIYGVGMAAYSIWLMYRIRYLPKYKYPWMDETKKYVLADCLAIMFFLWVKNMAILLDTTLFMRADSVIVNWGSMIAYTVIFAILSDIEAVYLDIDNALAGFNFWTFLFAGAFVDFFMFVPTSHRYFFWTMGLFLFIWGIHILWCYRHTGTLHAVIVLISTALILPIGFLIPELLGPAGVEGISYEYQTWWEAIAEWLLLLGLLFYLAYTLYRPGRYVGLMFTHYHLTMLDSRLHTHGTAGLRRFGTISAIVPFINSDNEPQVIGRADLVAGEKSPPRRGTGKSRAAPEGDLLAAFDAALASQS